MWMNALLWGIILLFIAWFILRVTQDPRAAALTSFIPGRMTLEKCRRSSESFTPNSPARVLFNKRVNFLCACGSLKNSEIDFLLKLSKKQKTVRGGF